MELTQKIISNFFRLGAAMVEAKQNDGKINLLDVHIVGSPALAFAMSLTDFDKIDDEWRAADAAQKAAFVSGLKAEFDLEDDMLEEAIEACVDAGLAVAKAFMKVSAVLKR